MVFHSFPGQNLFSAADTLTAGQVAPQSQFEESANDRGSRSWGGIQNQSTSTVSLLGWHTPVADREEIIENPS